MSLNQLNIHGFRNISSASFSLAPDVNIITGANGSGKTSILESLYFLSTGKSFRTSKNQNLVCYDVEEAVVFAKRFTSDGNFQFGIKRPAGRVATNLAKINGERVLKVSELAHQLPLQVVTPESFRLYFEGPKLRRKFFDLGMFHVEHQFHALWKQYRQLLKQRNALIKQGVKVYSMFEVWDRQLGPIGEELHRLRTDYLSRLTIEFEQVCQSLNFGSLNLGLQYSSGWAKDLSLSESLQQGFESDLRLGYTSRGASQFDVKFKLFDVNRSVEQVLSRGQLKRLLFALIVAQGRLISADVPCMFLIDDLPSELDLETREALAELLMKESFQLFITSIDSELVKAFCSKNSKMFHVEHGRIVE